MTSYLTQSWINIQQVEPLFNDVIPNFQYLGGIPFWCHTWTRICSWATLWRRRTHSWINYNLPTLSKISPDGKGCISSFSCCTPRMPPDVRTAEMSPTPAYRCTSCTRKHLLHGLGGDRWLAGHWRDWSEWFHVNSAVPVVRRAISGNTTWRPKSDRPFLTAASTRSADMTWNDFELAQITGL